MISALDTQEGFDTYPLSRNRRQNGSRLPTSVSLTSDMQEGFDPYPLFIFEAAKAISASGPELLPVGGGVKLSHLGHAKGFDTHIRQFYIGVLELFGLWQSQVAPSCDLFFFSDKQA